MKDVILLIDALTDPNVRAFLKMLRHGEGTDHGNGYRTLFGGGLFTSFADHPRRVIVRELGGMPIASSAAGAYQFLARTWDALVGQYGFGDFSPKNQDLAAVALIAGRGALADVRAGRFDAAVVRCNREWASLPGSPYGQPTVTLAKARALYLLAGGTFAANFEPPLPPEPVAPLPLTQAEAEPLIERAMAPGPPAAPAPPIPIALPLPTPQPATGRRLMDLKFDWKKLVAGIAPALGTALGGPMAGMAIKVIADKVLGEPDASEQDVAAAIASGQLSGDQVVALKRADQEFALRLREMDIDLVKLNQAGDDAVLKDVQDARARQVDTQDRMPQLILVVAFVIWIGTFYIFYFATMPPDEFVRALIVRAYATAEVALTGAVAFFIGSSRGSKRAGDAVREIAVNQSQSRPR